MPFQPCENAEPITGYVLRERLGAGGYGEVWKVSAPGGLTKAIKFVHGRMDDVRAARELKALSRIRDVRHPFLLSIERFDIVDSQLFVVTELADMSLADRFRECRESDLPGIPRDELLDYVSEAADALDYMNDKFGLQHLDIKPENLLLVGGHIKVADFGLVKDVLDTHATTIGGVTPLYATPEAFDGRASRFSDQYSLAIVYQEMLTGTLPFPGTTAAQLAVQHLHMAPLLGPLPVKDRAASGRALAKQPNDRFPTCREFVAAIGALPADTKFSGGEPESPPGQREASPTPCAEGLDETRHNADAAIVYEDEVPEPAELPPVDLQLDQPGMRPTIFVGVGGTGMRVLRRLRRLLEERFGPLARMPALQTVLFDTDSQALASAESGTDGEAMAPDDLVHLPLRKSADYRLGSDRILGWLSRRWLYNIPRSLRTDGLRPLGRLAFIDHSEKAIARLSKAIDAATNEKSLAIAAEAIGSAIRNKMPRVFVIASAAGGTGGGMVLDVAQSARNLLAERGFKADDVCGVLTHFTLNRQSLNDLLKTNAFATLTELNHLCCSAAEAHPAANPRQSDPRFRSRPFGTGYLVHLGDNLAEAQLDQACDLVAQYLFLDAATPAGGVLDQLREPAAGKSPFTFRSVGLFALDCDKSSVARASADELCRELLVCVCRPLDDARGQAVETEVAGWLASSDLNPERLLAKLRSAGAVELAGAEKAGDRASMDTVFRGLLDDVAAGRQSPDEAGVNRFFNKVRALIGVVHDNESAEEICETPLEIALNDFARALTIEEASRLVKSILALVEDSTGRIAAGLSAIDAATARLHQWRQGLEGQLAECQQRIAGLRLEIQAQSNPPASRGWLDLFKSKAVRGDLSRRLVEYASRCFDRLLLSEAAAVLRTAAGQVSNQTDQLVRLRQRVDQLGRSFADGPSASVTAAPGPAVPRTARGRVLALEAAEAAAGGIACRQVLPIGHSPNVSRPEYVAEFDRLVQRELFAPEGGLVALGQATTEAWKALQGRLRAKARQVLLESMQDINAARIVTEAHPNRQNLLKMLSQCLDRSAPRLACRQGPRRVLTLYPKGKAGHNLLEAFRATSSPISAALEDGDCQFVVCQEAEQLPIGRVAAAIIDGRPDYVAAARRVLTRVDVAWKPLPLPRPADDSFAPAPASPRAEPACAPPAQPVPAPLPSEALLTMPVALSAAHVLPAGEPT